MERVTRRILGLATKATKHAQAKTLKTPASRLKPRHLFLHRVAEFDLFDQLDNATLIIFVA